MNARDMTDAERWARHERSMKLYDRSIACSQTAIFMAALGIAYMPMLFVAISLLCASVLIGMKAYKVSPYGEGK